LTGILKKTWKDFRADECTARAAALAYSTIFALPPLLILIVIVAGKVWGADQVQASLETQFAGLIGADAAKPIHDMIAHGQNSQGRGVVASVLGIAGLLLGATGAFLALQDALNHAWEVKPDPKRGGVKNLLFKRLLSLGMVLGLGFLVAVSLALSAGVSAVTSRLAGPATSAVAYVIDIVVSVGVLGMLFAALLKLLPDAKVAWRSVWIGGFATAVLFVIGKFAIGLYLGHSKPGDSFGAASALAIILIWIYFAGIIVLLGAEFTQAWAAAHGHEIIPKKGAIRTRHIEVVEPDAGGAAPAPTPGPKRDTPTPRPVGVKEWVLGLPVLYWFIKSKKS
jgi:membrane protein